MTDGGIEEVVCRLKGREIEELQSKMINIQKIYLGDISVWCETLSVTSSLLTGLPFFKRRRHSKWWMEKKAAAPCEL